MVHLLQVHLQQLLLVDLDGNLIYVAMLTNLLLVSKVGFYSVLVVENSCKKASSGNLPDLGRILARNPGQKDEGYFPRSAGAAEIPKSGVVLFRAPNSDGVHWCTRIDV